MAVGARDYIDKLLVKKYADEKGVVRGKPVMLLYRISKAAETYGLDSLVPNGFDTSID